MPRLDGRVALVTGGSGGIGRAAALELAREGADVVVQYNRGKEAAFEVADQLRALGRRGTPIRADVTDPTACRAMVESAVASHGGLDIVACFAGYPFRIGEWNKAFDKLSSDEFRHPINVDLLGSIFVAQAALPEMAKRKRGSLILIGSTPAITGDIVGIPYLVAKAGVLALTKALAHRYGSQGIRVNALALGSISTGPMDALSEREKKALATEPALKRWGTAEEVARVVVFLASDDSSYVTGQTLVVDGGYAMR